MFKYLCSGLYTSKFINKLYRRSCVMCGMYVDLIQFVRFESKYTTTSNTTQELQLQLML